jgi:hypothetical protein
MLKDEAFRADLARAKQVLNPRSWQDSARIIRESVDADPDIIAYARELMAAGRK